MCMCVYMHVCMLPTGSHQERLVLSHDQPRPLPLPTPEADLEVVIMTSPAHFLCPPQKLTWKLRVAFLLKSMRTAIWCVDTWRMCLFTIGPEGVASSLCVCVCVCTYIKVVYTCTDDVPLPEGRRLRSGLQIPGTLKHTSFLTHIPRTVHVSL